MSLYYVLDGKRVIALDDAVLWGQWMQDAARRRVKLTRLPGGGRVSTVFLGLDHNFGTSDSPLLFETMVFDAGSSDDIACRRYATWEEAEAGHDDMLRELAMDGEAV